MSRPQIIVDPTKSLQAHQYDKSSSFFANELSKARELIKAQFNDVGPITSDELRPDKDLRDLLHRHEAICILGPRGAGKTSFMLSLIGSLRDDGEVQVLRPLDPTLLESDADFLPTIVSNILQALSADEQDEDVGRTLADVARGLHAVSGAGRSDDADPLTYAQALLDGAHGSLRLDATFHRFVAAAAKRLGRIGFVQPLDDVDVAFERGWTVLEGVRRYLSSARIATVISGDLDLYRMLVRGVQWDKLSQLIKTEKQALGDDANPRMKAYADQVERLEGQYLTKILPPGRRVRLVSVVPQIVDHVRDHKRELVQLRWGEDGELHPLSGRFVEFSAAMLGWDFPATASSLQALDPRSWPPARMIPWNTRLLVRFFDLLKRLNDSPEVRSNELDDRLARLRELFDDGFHQHRLTGDELRAIARGEGYFPVLNHVLAGLVGYVASPWRLTGQAGVGEAARRVNQVEWSIQAHLYRGWLRTDGHFRPMQFGLLVVWPSLVLAAALEEVSGQRDRLRDSLVRHLDYAESNLAEINGRLLGWQITSASRSLRYVPGAVRIPLRHGSGRASLFPALATPRAQSKSDDLTAVWWAAIKPRWTDAPSWQSDGTLAPRMEELQRRCGYAGRLVLGLFSTYVKTHGGAGTLPYADFFIGLARILRIAKRAQQEFTEWRQSVDWMGEPTAYPARFDDDHAVGGDPGAMTDLFDTEPEDAAQSGSISDEEQATLEALHGAMRAWSAAWIQPTTDGSDTGSSHAPPSPTLISMAFERLRASLDYASYKKGLPSSVVGRLLELWTVSFLNALLIEEISLYAPRIELRRARIWRSPGSFFHNLDRVRTELRGQSQRDRARMLPRVTLWWSCCPVLLAVLPKERCVELSEHIGELAPHMQPDTEHQRSLNMTTWCSRSRRLMVARSS